MSHNGIIIVDKPADWTSHDVIAKLRGFFKQKRIGHGGTLDPMATGVLPVFLGCVTRAAQYCENAEKEYVAGLRLGLVTDTQDITGNIIDERETTVSAEELSAIMPRFLGSQKQIPPMYSAIKQNGKKLYELARRGVEVPRPARDIHISTLEMHGVCGDDYLLRIVCSKGTYIRTLCHDIGAALGCGGTMSSLRRMRVGNFTAEASFTLDRIFEVPSPGNIGRILMPVDTIFSMYPAATLDENAVRNCKNGAPCRIENLEDGRYRFYRPDGEFLALGDMVGGEIKVIKRFFEHPKAALPHF